MWRSYSGKKGSVSAPLTTPLKRKGLRRKLVYLLTISNFCILYVMYKIMFSNISNLSVLSAVFKSKNILNKSQIKKEIAHRLYQYGGQKVGAQAYNTQYRSILRHSINAAPLTTNLLTQNNNYVNIFKQIRFILFTVLISLDN